MTGQAHAPQHPQTCTESGVTSAEPQQGARPLTDEEITQWLRRILRTTDMKVSRCVGPASMRLLPMAADCGPGAHDSHDQCTVSCCCVSQTVTQTMIRKQLAAETGMDMEPRKAFINEQAC
jgi:DEK C terminal domain